jgi:hypothetical protein
MGALSPGLAFVRIELRVRVAPFRAGGPLSAVQECAVRLLLLHGHEAFAGDYCSTSRPSMAQNDSARVAPFATDHQPPLSSNDKVGRVGWSLA